MSELRWRRKGTVPGADYGVFRSGFVDAEHPHTGDTKRFSVLSMGDWVNIIALTPDDRIVVLRQYRPGTDSICLEIPGGMIDPGEQPDVAAARELVEETGYVAKHWRELGRVSPNPALQGNNLYTFLALDAERTEAPSPDGGEVLDVETMSLAEITTLLKDGAIDHALVVVAFAHLMLAAGGSLARPAW